MLEVCILICLEFHDAEYLDLDAVVFLFMSLCSTDLFGDSEHVRIP
jgi:hypothetical protein